MSWRSYSDTNEDFIDQLKEKGIIRNDKVRDVMKQTDRKLYCRVSLPYSDRPFSIGYSATISAPHMHAFALHSALSFIRSDSKILDVGSGSGFLTACFARLIEAKSKNKTNTGIVVGIEHHPKLVEFSIGNLNSDDPKFIEEGRIKIIQGDGRLGCEEFAPYDFIHVGAAAAETPEQLLIQLKVGGRMIIPIGPAGDTQKMEQYEKTETGEIIKETLMSVVYVPLTDLKE